MSLKTAINTRGKGRRMPTDGTAKDPAREGIGASDCSVGGKKSVLLRLPRERRRAALGTGSGVRGLAGLEPCLAGGDLGRQLAQPLAMRGIKLR